jgi:two-component system CheB/CheR fusion protein
VKDARDRGTRTGSDDTEFEALLEFLRRNRGFDFTGYKRSSLVRRVTKRMQAVGIGGFTEYVDHLQVHPDEFVHLFNTILINVTGFFRDPQVWEHVAEDIAPRIVESKAPGQPIRCWCAGTASGEEAYTVAMILTECLGRQAFADRVKIYATDVDEEALAQARLATYGDKSIADVPEALRARYFQHQPGGHLFDQDLRRSVIFGRHDLVQDPPISRIDLLVCRNTLMYFNAETQARVMAHLHFGLNPGGFLLLGKAEMPLTHLKSFRPVDLKRRLFAKAGHEPLRERLLLMAQEGNLEASRALTDEVREHEAAFEAAPVAQIVVDRAGILSLANERARTLFGLKPDDVGRRFQDLELSYRPLELRSRFDEAYRRERPLRLPEVPVAGRNGERIYVDVQIIPLLHEQEPIGMTVTFHDMTEYRALREQLEHANQELETAMEELQSTNEELETTNEELHSTNEELETTNEELHSTNEELETMNEELQSTNEELQAINQEMRRRSAALNEVNAFLESILSTVQAAVVVLDPELRIKIWNERARELWGLRDEEVSGQPFLNLDIGLPVESVKRDLEDTITGATDFAQSHFETVDRRGQAIRCRLSISPLFDGDGERRGVILQIEPEGMEATA